MMLTSRSNLRVFVGYDSREDIAYQVCKASILEHNPGAEVYPLRLDDLRERGLYWRPTDPLSATEFSFSRFLVPTLTDHKGWALFMDCDFLVRHSLDGLWDYADPEKAVCVVKHEYEPTSLRKMDGQAQRRYPRKNWSSFMFFNTGHYLCYNLTPEIVNGESGMYLHRFMWANDNAIGELPPTYNYLEGWHTRAQVADPIAVHFTEGGPWFDGYQNVEYAYEWNRTAGRVRASER
jgi:lipopolysaccharide biosynthesis glycosyltransferase